MSRVNFETTSVRSEPISVKSDAIRSPLARPNIVPGNVCRCPIRHTEKRPRCTGFEVCDGLCDKCWIAEKMIENHTLGQCANGLQLSRDPVIANLIFEILSGIRGREIFAIRTHSEKCSKVIQDIIEIDPTCNWKVAIDQMRKIDEQVLYELLYRTRFELRHGKE